MNNRKILFISFNNSYINVYNPTINTINKTDFINLKNLAVENYIVVCNKHLLNQYVNSSILDTKFKDILYLYAILFPNKFVNNSIISLAKVLNITIPKNLSEQAHCLYNIYNNLLKLLNDFSIQKKTDIITINKFISEHTSYWEWNDEISFYLSNIEAKDYKYFDHIPSVQVSNNNIKINKNNYLTEDLTLQTFNKCVKKFGDYRKLQKDYTLSVSQAFNVNSDITEELNNTTIDSSINITNQHEVNKEVKTNIVFAEAGTGIGKTLGYLAASIAFIENNPENRVIISTYSKALQNQILNELKLCLDKEFIDNKVALIRGQDNYICLLNLENLFSYINNYKNGYIFLGIILRWVQESENGDLHGGDFLVWLHNIIPYNIMNNIVIKQGECIYSSCKHYKKCFITKVKEKAKKSNIIISNHNLTLVSKFNSDYFIFDEAHNLYNVCDDVYEKKLSVQSGLYLRRWLFGRSNFSKTPNKNLNGIKNRIKSILFFLDKDKFEYDDNIIQEETLSKTNNSAENNSQNLKKDCTQTLQTGDEMHQSEEEVINFKINRLVDILINASNFLTNEDYLLNIGNQSPKNIFEEFLYYLYQHVLVHNDDLQQYYTIESKPINLSKELTDSANKLYSKLEHLLEVANSLQEVLIAKIAFINNKENKEVLLEFINSYKNNCVSIIEDFLTLLKEMISPKEEFIYRFAIVKEEGKICDVGYFKNLTNPLQGFSNSLVNGKKGIVFTSATLFDNKKDDMYLLNKFALNVNKVNVVSNISLKSPFDYVKNTKIIILKNNSNKNVALKNEALLQLFLASQGGVLAIFTSIQRLKDNYNRLKNNFLLREKEINILSQYADFNKLTSIINFFKEDENSCLLGSDGFRDGIDIPGKSLRMVVFEKVPWSKPTILYKARKNIYGKDIETETVKIKLKQAFGRLLRNKKDKGIFVILESKIPSEFLEIFPENIEIHKVSLEEAITLSRDFLKNYI